jgi:outer membrane lipoprotein-sorting protein
MRLTSVLLLVAALTLAVRPAARAAERDLFDDLFARIQPQGEAMRTVTARFVETSTSALLREPLVARGRLSAERPSRLRLDYEVPEKRTLIVDETSLVVDWPSRSEHTVRDISQAQQRVQKYFVAKDPDELRRHFDIHAFVDPAVPGTWQIAMTPKRKQIREGLVDLQVWIDQRSLFMRQMRMVFATGDTKTFALDEAQLNAPLPPGLFVTGAAARR